MTQSRQEIEHAGAQTALSIFGVGHTHADTETVGVFIVHCCLCHEFLLNRSCSLISWTTPSKYLNCLIARWHGGGGVAKQCECVNTHGAKPARELTCANTLISIVRKITHRDNSLWCFHCPLLRMSWIGTESELFPQFLYCRQKQLPSTARLHDYVVVGCSKIMWICQYPWSRASKRTWLRANTVVNIQREQNSRSPTVSEWAVPTVSEKLWGFYYPYRCSTYTICVKSELFPHFVDACTEGITTPS